MSGKDEKKDVGADLASCVKEFAFLNNFLNFYFLIFKKTCLFI